MIELTLIHSARSDSLPLESVLLRMVMAIFAILLAPVAIAAFVLPLVATVFLEEHYFAQGEP